MNTNFFRFPTTAHLAWLANDGTPRDDKVLSAAEVRQLLSSEVVVEEKLDGANLGLSLSSGGVLRAQNRGQYLDEPHAGQFSRLPGWLAQHEIGLRTVLRLLTGHTTLESLKQLLLDVPSRYRAGLPLVGVVVRRESAEWCEARAKLVRPDFAQAIDTHWRKRAIEWNRVDWAQS